MLREGLRSIRIVALNLIAQLRAEGRVKVYLYCFFKFDCSAAC